MLVRIDVLAPDAAGAARWGEDVAIVLDGRGPDALALCGAALARLGARDRVIVVDAAGARVHVPAIPASNRSLVLGGIERALRVRRPARRDVPRAVSVGLRALTRGTLRRVLVLSDEPEAAREEATRALGEEWVPLEVVGTSAGGDTEGRLAQVRAFVPAAGAPAFRNVVLAFEGVPAPSHVLEASGGDARWELEGGELALGDVRAGEERTEVVRVTIPAWTPGEAFTLHVAGRFEAEPRPGEVRRVTAEVPCTYDDDVERLAGSRNGDIIAYASALATLARLDAAFIGGTGCDAAGLRPLARMHARSLALLARDTGDPAAAERAALLEGLLAAVPE
jgi:hypothetical protein